MIPAFAGVLGGAATIGAMWRVGLLAERSGVAVLLCAIAFFYPVFAVMADAGLLLVAVHIAIFLAFAGFAAYGFRAGMSVLALGLMAHGFFDLVAMTTGQPGPAWWPAFCAALDITAGLCLLALRGRSGVTT